ncbi:uncharacterized protein TNCV_988321 [Trichonephila clavipes]|nr:uncharacterized protein TNCV_988321 [Trichonephila clavipes]
MTRRRCYTHDFLAESQKLLERAPTSKDAGLTPPVQGLSNISKYPGHLPDIAYYDGSPRNQGLVGVDGACVKKTHHMASEEDFFLCRRGQASVLTNLLDHPAQSISQDMHFAHLR